MVSDSLDTGTVRRFGPKIFRRETYLVGTAGASGLLQRMLAGAWPKALSEDALSRWVARFGENVDHPQNGTMLLLASADRVWTVEGSAVYWTRGVAAAGCGAAYALGYLEAKAGDLVGAVRAACKHDPWCGGKVADVRLDQKKRPRR